MANDNFLITKMYNIDIYVIDETECGLREQPSGPNPYVRGAHESQQRPITFGLHSHCPPNLLQDEPYAPTG